AVFTWSAFNRDGGPPAEGEISRDTLSVQVLPAAGDTVYELGLFLGDERVVLQSGEVEGGFSITISSTTFGRSTRITGGVSGIWIGDTDRFEIRRYSLDGQLQTLVRRSLDPIVVDDALVERAMAEELEGADDDQRRQIRRRWESSPLPPTLPAFETLQVDRTGNLWVSLYPLPGAHERTWSVFAPDGAWLGDVTFPDRFRPLEIGDDYVLGRFSDELDVEHVQIWELVKPIG
ncbi:MAG: hypothetical protein WBP17_08305, partial [Gemmatimonadota bacterium]